MMNQRSYSPKRYGRSEYAPIVIDMVDYGNDDSADDYAYSLQFSSPHRHPPSNHQSSPRHVTETHHSSPRPSSTSRPSSPRHSRTSPRHKTRSPPFPGPSTNSRETVQMHNFAQRRSFMMGGAEYADKDCQDQNDPDRIYHVEEDEAAILEYAEYQMGAALNDGISDNEYRQSPGRPRNFPIYDDADTRDRAVPIEAKGGHGAKDTKDYHDHHDDAPRDLSLYNIGSFNKYDSYAATTPHSLSDHQKATFLVMNRMKRSEEGVFTFNDANDDDVHTVPGVINRHEEKHPDDIRESMSVAPANGKKVFYFDIDDLSQRLLNNGDQDLSRRLRKKKQKNARDRASRSGRPKSTKSKKSVFNLELDTSVIEILQGNNQNIDNRTVVTEPAPSSRRSAKQPEGQIPPDSNPRNALYVDTTNSIDRVHRAPGSPLPNVSARDEIMEKSLLRNPSVGSQPAEQINMEYDEHAYQQAKSNSSSPSDSASVASSAGRPRRERPTRSDKMVQEEKKTNVDNAADDKSTRSKAKSPKDSTAVSKTIASSEKRATKVYDEINNRLDHIVRREGDVENRQNAIRAVFEEVQQHVAELKKKGGHQTTSNEEKGKSTEDRPDHESKTKAKRNASDQGSEQVIKDAEIAFRMSELAANENAEQTANSTTVCDADHEAVKIVSSDGEGDAAKSLSRPSAYLSSDNSCDDVGIQEQTSDAEDDGSVYVVEEEAKSDVTQVDVIQPNESMSSAKEQDRPEVEEDANGEDSAPYQFKAHVDEHDDGTSHEPDGDKADHATNVQDSKNAEEDDEKHNRAEEARKQAIRGENVDKNVLDSDADEAEVDIDTEFDRVVPNDTESPSIDYNIDETLDRVARQTELEKNIRDYAEKSGGTSHGDEEEKANALLDGIGQTDVFAHKHEPQSPTSDHTRSSQKSFKSEKDKHCSENLEDKAEASLSNRTRTDEDEDDDDDEVSMDYDFNLAISAATKSSDSASDLQEFSLKPKKEYDDQYDSASSDVSSDISVSSSESVSTESSYDSFISIVETEDDSDLEFFDEQEGFAENFMSNLVSSTFGWFEKKQEQLVCGFKSGEFHGPSLLRQSLTKKKQEEAEEEKEKSRGKTMKNLHNAVATKYGGEKAALSMPNTATAKTDKKKKHPTKKKEIKRSHKHGLSEKKQGEGRKVVNSPRQRNEKRNSVADPRKTSLLVNSKSSESDQNVQEVSPKSEKEKSRRQSLKESISDKHQDEVASKKSDAAVVNKYNRKSNRKPASPATETSEPTDPYNFDFLNSEDDEAGLSSVKTLDFKSFDKEKRSELKKKGKGTEKAMDPDEFVFIGDDADSTAAAKTSRPRRSTKQPNGSVAQSPKSQRTLSPRPSGPMSPGSQSTTSKALSPRSNSSIVTAEKVSSKRVSSKSPGKIMAPSKHTKTTKKTSKKEKTSSRLLKTSAVGSKRNQHTTSSKRRDTESRDRSMNTELEDKHDPSESDTDDNFMEMDDEEREVAGKERRRAAALKRRRKLRERRRAKLEQNLTDDTFG